MGRQRVEVARRRQLDGLHAEFGRGAADHDRQMIGRARRGAQGQHLLLQERQHAVFCQHRRRRLEQKTLVGAAAALGHEHELVGVIALGIDLALRRHVVGGVFLLIHRQRRHLRIAQIAAQIGVARALGQRGLVVAVGDDAKTLLAHDDRGAGILAHRQHAAGGDVGVLQKIQRDELVVGAGLAVVEDIAQLLQMPRPQIMVDVAERGLRQRPQRLARHHQHVLAQHVFDPHALGGDLPVRRGVGARAGTAGCACRAERAGGTGKAVGAFMWVLARFGAEGVRSETPHRRLNRSKHFWDKGKVPLNPSPA